MYLHNYILNSCPENPSRRWTLKLVLNPKYQKTLVGDEPLN